MNLGMLLAFVPFVNPVPFPSGARLWMFLPLAFCVSLVYRATRATQVEGLLGATIRTFIYVVLSMVAIAVGLYVISELAIRYF